MPAEQAFTTPHEEQFVDARQQYEAVTLGMWIFIASEFLFFGAPLLAYTAYRHWYYADFAAGSRHLDFLLGTINTAILLASGFLMSGAVTAARLLDRRTTVLLLALTALLGAVFLGIKGYEWHTAIDDGFWPAATNTNAPHGVHLFYSLYFTLTGLHGVHLLIGIVFLAGTAWHAARQRTFRPNPNYYYVLGLYWHFVDIIWVFLYPLLYFIGRSS